VVQNMNYQVVAAGLKYLGLIVGTASSIWGALSELKKDGPDGRKVLTRPGKISIAVTIISLVVSLTSAAVEERLARQSDKRATDQRQADSISELRRHQELISSQLQVLGLSEKTREEDQGRFNQLTRQQALATRNILIAAQSLRQISITWTFPHANSIKREIFKSLADDEAQLDEEWGKDPHDGLYYQKFAQFNYEDVVRSLILRLGDASQGDKYALALFALDDAGSVILPLGFLNVDQLRSQHFVALPSLDFDVAAGIQLLGNDVPTRKRRLFASSFSYPNVPEDNSNVELHWDIAGADAIRAIDKSDPSLIPILPQVMRVAIITEIRELIVNPSQTSEQIYSWNIWDRNGSRRGRDLAVAPFRGSRLRIVPNGIEDMARTYEMREVSSRNIGVSYDVPAFCEIEMWEGTPVSTDPR